MSYNCIFDKHLPSPDEFTKLTFAFIRTEYYLDWIKSETGMP